MSGAALLRQKLFVDPSMFAGTWGGAMLVGILGLGGVTNGSRLSLEDVTVQNNTAGMY